MGFWNPGKFAGGFFTGPFNPASITETALWLEGDRGTTLDTNATTTVSTWVNQASAGSKYNAAQATKANQPTYITEAVNGYPALRFNGSTNLLSITGSGLDLVNNIAGATLVTAIKPKTAASTIRLFYASVNASNAIRLNADQFTSRRFFIGSRRLDADTASSQGTSINAYTADAWSIVTFYWDFTNTTMKVWVNGTNVLNYATFQTSGSTQSSDSQKINIGAGDNAVYYDSDMAAFQFIRRAITDSERQYLERGYGAKYGITVA